MAASARQQAIGARAARRAFCACACLIFPACQLALLVDELGTGRGGRTGRACAQRELTVAASGCALFVAALAALGSALENAHMLLACALSSLVPFVRSCQAGAAPDADGAERAVAVACALLEAAVCALALLLWRGFGWRAYAVVGGDVRLNAHYAACQAFEAAALLCAEALCLLALAVHALGAIGGPPALAVGALALACVPVQVFAVRAEYPLVLALALALPACGGVGCAGALPLARSGGVRPPAWLCAAGGGLPRAEAEAMRALALGACALAAAAVLALVLRAGRASVHFGSGALRLRAGGRARAAGGRAGALRGVRWSVGGAPRGARGRFALGDFAAETIAEGGPSEGGPDAEAEAEPELGETRADALGAALIPGGGASEERGGGEAGPGGAATVEPLIAPPAARADEEGEGPDAGAGERTAPPDAATVGIGS